MTGTRVYRMGKMVGVYDAKTNTFTKMVSFAKHYMKMMGGYGIDESVYAKLLEKNSKIIIIEDSKTELRSDVTDWKEHGVSRDFKHGMQRFLSCKYMQEFLPNPH